MPNLLGTEKKESAIDNTLQSLLGEQRFQKILITKKGELECIPLSTNINLKCEKRMFYFPRDFGELTIDGLMETGALFSAISVMDLRKTAYSLSLYQSSVKVILQTSNYWSLVDN